MALQEYPLFIDGKPSPAAGGEWFDTVNPYTGEVWARIAKGGKADVDRAVAAAKAALAGEWGRMTPTARGKLMRRRGDLVSEHAESLARTEARDNGKLYAEMLGHTRYHAAWWEYFGVSVPGKDFCDLQLSTIRF